MKLKKKDPRISGIENVKEIRNKWKLYFMEKNIDFCIKYNFEKEKNKIIKNIISNS